MMLRSSSTPVLGSLLSSFSESPSHHHHHPEPHTTIKHPPTAAIHHQNHKKLSYHQSGSLNYTQVSCNSSPISPSIADLSGGTPVSINGFRRAQSEGNLKGLLADASSNPDDEFSISNLPKKFARRPNCSHLETIPSFSFHNARIRYEEEDSGGEEEEENGRLVENSITTEESRAVNTEKQRMGVNDEMRLLSMGENKESPSEMYLARGLGVERLNIGFGGSGGGEYKGGAGGRGGGGGDGGGSAEEHYKRLVEENPGNPLFLRNYAQFLYESKKDTQRAEEYYSRAILADPKDGEVLSQYAKVVWELHHDQDRASSYFERAVHAAPADSHVHAAYASFLWETEEGDDDANGLCVLPSHFQNGALASANA
ncbi:tetratricopeptide repeat (TPR)-like superfamily protein [Actinidia rufa]|uniref:Tetratricopeptide repeat (TPR)-like superfamily protein n=1 Tax=Actinidia rufa TaxID=165716 RepID=A0A7J0H3H1_9ERIC|nr:tetratricopeptide repeat (TPR)-like superfamily protein [Actinidia rufa]